MENDIVTLAAERLVDWRAAALVGRSVAGAGGIISPTERAQLADEGGLHRETVALLGREADHREVVL